MVLPHKLNAWKIALLSLGLSLRIFIEVQFEFISPLHLLVSLFLSLLLLIVPIFIYTGSLWKRYAVFIYFNLLAAMSDAIAWRSIVAIYSEFEVVTTEIMPLLLYSGIGMSAFIIFGSISILIWKMIAIQKFQLYFLMFFILPISQLMVFYGTAYDYTEIFLLIGLLMGLSANLVLLIYVVSLEKKAALQTELTELQHIRELEQLHYAGVEQLRQELIKIRHDFNNQLTTAYKLISTDKKDHAQKLLDELKSLADIEEYQYCQNPIVNAVLTEKQKECEVANIRLETNINIHENCNIAPTHLCSIFTNLLDNAIRACKHIPQEQRRIELRTATKGDYLHIKCVNPVTDQILQEKKKQNSKGYGKIILSDIAEHYNGNFAVEIIDCRHIAVVSVLNLK